MKVALMNYSGNVGKSTAAKHVFAPRMPDSKIFSIESINSDGSGNDDMTRGKKFFDTVAEMERYENSIADVGSSNIEEVLKAMSRFPGWHEDFDYIVVPTIPMPKQLRDTIATIDALAEQGVPASKIRVWFNQLDEKSEIEDRFASIFKYHRADKNSRCDLAPSSKKIRCFRSCRTRRRASLRF